MARWMLSFGIDTALAFCTARRRRGFIDTSGVPVLAATVISRASLENIFERTASWRPLRCMMFLNCEWPAMGSLSLFGGRVARRPHGRARNDPTFFDNGRLIDKSAQFVQRAKEKSTARRVSPPYPPLAGRGCRAR